MAEQGKRNYQSHKDHLHPATKAARDKCRRIMRVTGQPWDGVEVEQVSPETRGKKAAATRARHVEQEQQAGVVETLLDATDPDRDEHGRFARLTSDEWRSVLESLDGAADWLASNATLINVELRMTVGGVNLHATYDGNDWSIGTE